VIDPTANVLSLVEAAVTRLNDVAVLRAELADVKAQRIEDLSAQNERHSREIRALDADRLEKVRLVDQLNANQLAQQIRSAVDTLATTTQATAETLRNQAQATAQAVAAQTERIVNPIIERIAALERASYTGQGRQAVSDPQMERLAALVEKLATTQTTSTGKSAGQSSLWVFIVGGVGLLMTMGSLALAALGAVVGVVMYFAK
jgi:hypothetical protein